MFLRYLDPLFKPWRDLRNKILRVRTIKGNIQSDVRRVKRFGNTAKSEVKKVKGKVTQAQNEAQKAQGQVQQMQGQVQQAQGQFQQMQGQVQGARGQAPQGAMPKAAGMAPMQGMPQGAQMQGQAGSPGGLNPNPPLKVVGLFKKKKVCTQCNAELDMSWDSCPYCAQNAAAAQGPAAAGPAKTQAIMIDAGGPGGMQLLGWLVPIKGAQRGELYTLAPHSIVGTDPACQIVLNDTFMSSRHAEIKVEAGKWILRDLGSTNGTYVNDKRVSQHELVDSDFINFGRTLVKFKSL